MIDELQILLDTVSDVPSIAAWLIVAFLLYKFAIAGSIVAASLAAWRVAMATIEKVSGEKTARTTIKESRSFELDGFCITGCETALRAQIGRLAGKGTRVTSKYIHPVSVDWLRDAIDAKERADDEARSTLESVRAVNGRASQ